MERMVELKRKSRNLSEKKRRDQFNTLINELNNLIDPHFNNIDSNDNNGATSNINGGVSYTNNISYNIFNQQSAPTNGLGTFESASSGRYKSAGSTTSSIAGSVSRQRKLDKSSVLRCAMEFLKKQSFSSSSSSSISSFSTSGSFDGKKLDNGGSNMDSVCESFENNYIESWKPSYITDDEFSMQMLETLDAFIVVCEVNSEARIVYSSDTLSSLLRYTGTCSSIESHDYVSLFDLIAPFDRPQIEKIFVDQTSSNINGGNATTSGCNTNSGKNNNQSTANTDSRSSSPSSQPSEYISMVVNFRNNLNLTKIKLKRLQQSNGDSSSTLFEQQNDDKISQDDSSSLSRKSNHQQHQGHQQQEEDQQQQQQQVMQQQHKQQSQPLVGQQQLHQRQQQNFHCSHNNQQQQQQQSNQMRRQKQTLASSRQQYELVRLMATFRGLDINTIRAEDSSFDRYKFEEPPPNQTNQKSRYFICIGRLDVPRLSYDLKIIVPPLRGGTNLFHNNQFISKHTLKWRLLWVDNRASAIIGYLPFEVLGTSGYDYYHWDDLDKLVICHEGLMRSGQATSGPYRFLTKGQQWIWLQTKYSIIPKPAKGNASNQFKFILCTHTVVGFDENDGYVNSATECFS